MPKNSPQPPKKQREHVFVALPDDSPLFGRVLIVSPRGQPRSPSPSAPTPPPEDQLQPEPEEQAG